MRSFARAAFAGVLAAAPLVSCSKSLAPVSPNTNPGADVASPGWTSARVREPQTARARLRVVGSVVTLDAEGRPHVQQNAEFLVDSDGSEFPTDMETVPALAEVKQVRWRVTGGGSEYVVDNHPEAHPPLGPLQPGPNGFYLRVPERAGGGIHLVMLRANFEPDGWWAGPDPSRFPASSDGDGRAVDVTDWSTFTTVPAWPPDGRSYFGPDSFQYVPSRRLPPNGDLEHRTFYEIWGDRIYARSEGDAVHQGAWLVFVAGGSDRDSPYVPRVDGPAPTLPPGFESQPRLYPLLIEQGLIGSPIGFRHRVPVRLESGQILQPSETLTYPSFITTSITYQPQVFGYARAEHVGKAYSVIYAVDSHGTVDRSVDQVPGGAIGLADRVDAGGGTAAERLLRSRVLTFHVRAADGLVVR